MPTSGMATKCATSPGHRRLSDAVDGRFPATAAEGFASRVARTTDSTIYHVVEVAGRSSSAMKPSALVQKISSGADLAWRVVPDHARFRFI